MEIKFQGKYDKSTFYKAVRLANKPAGNQRKFLWFMLLFAVGSLILLLYRVFDTGDFLGNAVLLVGAVIMVVVVGGIFIQPIFIAWKLWSNPGVRRDLKGQISNRGISYVLQEGINEIRWDRISRIRISEAMITMIRSDGLMLVFPQGFFKRDSDWRKFQKLVEEKSVRK